MKNKAFTLAETLITLVIVGIVAALTVPTMINKMNKQEYVSKLKKAYSVLSQATNMIISEEGLPKNGWATSNENIYNLYKKHLNKAKDCGHSSGCFDNIKYTYLKANGNWSNSGYILILADGMQINFHESVYPNCNGIDVYGGSGNIYCAIIQVDINGEKKPNKWGRDLFQFYLRENGLYPSGCNASTYICPDQYGHGCACKVLREGEMNY